MFLDRVNVLYRTRQEMNSRLHAGNLLIGACAGV